MSVVGRLVSVLVLRCPQPPSGSLPLDCTDPPPRWNQICFHLQPVVGTRIYCIIHEVLPLGKNDPEMGLTRLCVELVSCKDQLIGSSH